MYLDSSILVPLVVAERNTTTIEAWIERSTLPLSTSTLALAEVASAISRRRRMGELTEAQGERAMTAFDLLIGSTFLTVPVLPGDVVMAARFVRVPSPKLLTPDAVHLALCRRQDYTLVTDDRGLVTAGQYHGAKVEQVSTA